MAWVTFIIIALNIFNVLKCEDCVIDNRTPDYSWELEIYRDLVDKCQYDSRKPPGNATNSITTVNISTAFIIKNFNFDSQEETLNIQTWISFDWFDERFRWDPKKHYNIDKIPINTLKIWIPNMRLINSIEEDNIEYFLGECEVESNGHVSCMDRQIYEVPCSATLKNWPYDIQNCTYKFGESKRLNTKMNFVFEGTYPISAFGNEFGTTWIIINRKFIQNLTSEAQLTLILTLVRQALTLSALIVVPTIICSALTLTTLVLNPESFVRLELTCFSLLCHFCVLQDVNELIPKQNAEIPIILLFIRGSIILTFVSFAFTFLLNYLCKQIIPPHIWIYSSNYYVLNTYWKLLIYFSWDINSDDLGETDGKKYKETWSIFANIINNIYAIIIFIIYTCLFFTFIPIPLTEFHFM